MGDREILNLCHSLEGSSRQEACVYYSKVKRSLISSGYCFSNMRESYIL